MPNILKNQHVLNLFDKPVEKMIRSHKKLPNIEALRLYRDFLKFTRMITWNNTDGTPWRLILEKSARGEFEQARNETDSLMIAKMLITSRDALIKLEEKFNDTQMQLTKHVQTTRND